MYSEAEYESDLERMNEIFEAEEGTVEGREADILMKRIEAYEETQYPIEMPEDDQ